MMKSRRSRFFLSASLAILAPAAATTGAGAQGELQGSGGRTQGGARVTFSSLEDWSLKGENLGPRGHNPLFFPLTPGFRYVLENPDHPWGRFRTEVVVLDKTEAFDVPGMPSIGCDLPGSSG